MNRNTIKIISLFSSLLVSSAVVAANSEITLSESSFGNLKLSHNMVVNLALLRSKLQNYNIVRKIGEQDGPDFVYYEVRKNRVLYCMLKTKDSNRRRLDRVYISNKWVSDQYGVSVGTPYSKIKALRPNIKITTDMHYHTYVYVSGSNIAYEITGDHEGPDKQNYTEREVLKWTVTNIVWLKLKE